MLAPSQLVYRTNPHTITITVQFSRQNVQKLMHNYRKQLSFEKCSVICALRRFKTSPHRFPVRCSWPILTLSVPVVNNVFQHASNSNPKSYEFFTHFISVLRVTLTFNNDYLPKERQMIGLFNGNWLFTVR
jgi:hypothetical protein